MPPFDPDAYLAAKPSEFDPDVYLKATAPAEPKTGVVQGTKVAARAASPYATAAAAGALMGAPLGGIPGAMGGAALGVGALGLSDIATGLYNIGASRADLPAVAQPSAAIQQLYGQFGVGAPPETPEQRMLASGVEGATAAFGQAKALNYLAPFFTKPGVQNVMRYLGASPLGQAGAGFGAGVGGQLAEEMGGGTAGKLAGSIIGGLGGGAAGTTVGELARGGQSLVRKPLTKLRGETELTPQMQRERASQLFEEATKSGALYRSDAFKDFTKRAVDKLEEAGYYADNPEQGALRGPIARMEKLSEAMPDIGALHSLRKQIGAAREHPSKDVRRLAGILTDELDDFILNSKNAVPSAQSEASKAGKLLQEGISEYRKLAKGDEIERLISRASLAQANTADALRSQFRTLANNPNRMRRFDKDEQAAIREIAEGSSGSAILSGLSKLAPGFDVKGLLLSGLALAPGAVSQSPEALAAGATLATLGIGARGARNVLAEQYARDLAANVRRGTVTAPVDFNRMARIAPIVQEYLRSEQP